MPSKKRRRPTAARTGPEPAAVVAPQAEATPKTRARPSNTDPDNEPRWSQLGLLVLLALVFVVQIPIGLLIHATAHTNLLIIDLFFFQPQYVLLACFLAMPLARIITRQPRSLRLLESLSLGAIYALLTLLLSTVFVHPASGSLSTEQFIKQLQVSDGVRIAFADVLALFGAVVTYPGINRLLGAPGRRARQRMLRRSQAGSQQPVPKGRRPKNATRPRR
jgi:hypothetical protein